MSYVSDQLIESTGSDFNEELYLLYVKGRYQLVTDKVIYSYEDKYDNFYESLKKVDLAQIKSCLILGFGLGSIPVILKKFGIHPTTLGIEIDEEILRLANKYVLDQGYDHVTTLEMDAYFFLDYDDSKYDLICFDIFDNDEIPQRFLTKGILTKLRKKLNPKGVLIMNTLYHLDQDKIASDHYYEKIFQQVFKENNRLFVRNNMMLFGKN
jgi:spermidine synthase